jgi:transposase
MRPFGSAELLECRRRQAMELLDYGLSLNEVARRLHCHASSVMRWRDARRTGGDAGLKPKPTPGRPAKLTRKQHDRLVRLLLKGAMAHGYRTELWTTARIADLIEEKFAVRYHRDHIGRLMASLGWTYQKPEKRALEHNDAAIEEWKRTEWRRIKKTPSGWRPISSSSTRPASS